MSEHKTPDTHGRSRQTPELAHLDARSEELARKHHRRLQSMTYAALDTRLRKQERHWLKTGFAAAAGTALSLAVAIGIGLQLQGTEDTRQSQIATLERQPDALMENLPPWVKDTDTPVELIENLEFYQWLAQQTGASQSSKASPYSHTPSTPNSATDQQHAAIQQAFLLALNDADDHRRGQRRTAADPAQGFSRTTAAAGKVE